MEDRAGREAPTRLFQGHLAVNPSGALFYGADVRVGAVNLPVRKRQWTRQRELSTTDDLIEHGDRILPPKRESPFNLQSDVVGFGANSYGMGESLKAVTGHAHSTRYREAQKRSKRPCKSQVGCRCREAYGVRVTRHRFGFWVSLRHDQYCLSARLPLPRPSLPARFSTKLRFQRTKGAFESRQRTVAWKRPFQDWS